MKRKGIFFTLDSLLFLAVVSLLVLSLPTRGNPADAAEFLALQKSHDLLRVWLTEGKFDEEEMARDFYFVFPEKEGYIELNGDKFFLGDRELAIACRRKIATDILYVNKGEVGKLALAICN